MQKLTVGTSRELTVDLPALLQAPRLELFDVWASQMSLNLTADTPDDLMPTDRPLCIKLDTDSEFHPDEEAALRKLGFEIIHSSPSCACCGTALSTWYAKYTNQAFEEKGFSATGLPESSISSLPCRWETCNSCNEAQNKVQEETAAAPDTVVVEPEEQT